MNYEVYYGELCRLQKALDDYQRSMISAPLDKKYDILKEVYDYLKIETAPLLVSGANPSYMKPLASNVHMMAEFLPAETIIDVKPYDFNEERELSSCLGIEGILDFLIYKERCRLFSDARKFGITPFEKYDPYDDCRDSALAIYKMAIGLGLDAKIKIIEPGYLYESPLYEGGCKHIVTLINFRGEPYLLDATYLQFFMRKRCLLERIGTIYISNPNPGIYMLMNESRKKTAQKLLDDGWIKLTPENMKNYFDGFTNFYRNGSYYEATADFSFEPTYTYLDYWKFLNEMDNQACHEGIENLGYQTRALKNPKMKFDKR